MKEYTIIGAPNIGRLATYVNALIPEGWQPHGSPFTDGWFIHTYYQALVKEDSQVREKEPVSIPIRSRSKN